MATTSIWKIEKRLDHVIEYAKDVDKTKNNYYEQLEYSDLQQALDYAMNIDKTEKQFFVSAINCLVETALEEMTITKKHYKKTKGILGFHGYQSFVKDEVSAEIAHDIGVKLANEIWGDRFEVVVSTHLNTDHIHNHFVVNSVSFKDGLRYYDNHKSYALIRQTSDAICQEYNLSVLKEKECKKSKLNYDNFYKGYIEKSNYHTIAKEDIDRAIAQAYSFRDFENLLKAMDYKIMYRAGKLSVCREPYTRNIRIERSFGEGYTIKNITERILETEETRLPFIEVYGNKKKYRLYGKIDKKKCITGIQKLYWYYCYLLKVFPKTRYNKKLPACIRVDVKKLEDISSEARLLGRNGIKTAEQLSLYKDSLDKTFEKLENQRNHLWYEHKKAKTYDEKQEIIKAILILSEEIKYLRNEVRLCKNIEERIPKIKSNIREMNKGNLKRKEQKKDEYIR